MARHRLLRIASTRDRVVTFRELWASDPGPFTPDQEAALDLGCTIRTDEGRITDLIAYYEVNEAERGSRALDLVS
jgi:hypothetical protein